MVIEGTVAPGFESVKQIYEHNMHALAEPRAGSGRSCLR